jgi:hypothetical protein
MAVDFASWLRYQSPPWLLGQWGGRYVDALGGLVDVTALGSSGAAGEAGKSHSVLLVADDGLPLHGVDRWLFRALGESAASWRARLSGNWSTIAGSSSTPALEALISSYFAGIPVQCYDVANDSWLGGYAAGNNEDNNANLWSRFWVVIEKPHTWAPWVFDPLITFGPGYLWGIDMSQSELSQLRRLAQEYRPAHMLPVEAWVIMDTTTAAALKASHALTANVIRLPLYQTHFAHRSLPIFGGGFFGGTFS